MKREESKKLLDKAFSLYSQGKLEAAYREFEKAMEVQPGEAQTQRYTMQLKKEIADGYYSAGNKAYSGKKYNTAIANWKAAKEWGRSQSEINGLIRKAEREKDKLLEENKNKNVKTTPEPEPETPLPPPPPLPDIGTVEIPPGGLPTSILTQQGGVVTQEARQASTDRYRLGLTQYNAGNYDKAKEEWEAALELDPNNSDAAMGLQRINEKYSNR
jgi:tetratricopeptide (TPR) repeat protein